MDIAKKIYWSAATKYHNLQKNIHELKSVGVEITNRCNLQCQHCYMSASGTGVDAIDTTGWKTFFDNLKKDFGNNVVIQITGGEPLFRNDLFELLDHLKRLEFRISLATNGVLLTEERLNKLSGYLSSLSISLDGFEKSHNKLRNAKVYEIVLKNIELAAKLMKYLVIKTTVYKDNFRELEGFYKFVGDLGVNEWHLFAMEPIGRGADNDLIISIDEYREFCEFVDKIKKDKNRKLRVRFEEEGGDFMYEKTCDLCKYKLCSAGISSCAILYNGDIVNCVQDDRRNLVVHGNITKDNFTNIWESKFATNRQDNYKYCNNHYFLNKLSNL